MTSDKGLLAGGIDPSLTTVTARAGFYKFEEGIYEPLPVMLQPRYSHSALLIEPNGVMVIGGRTFGKDPDCILDSCEFYDFSKKVWRPISPLNRARCLFEVLIWENRPYVFGGLTERGTTTDSIEVYEDSIGNWRELDIHLPTPLDSFRIIPAEKNHRIVILGGRVDGVENTSQVLELNLQDGSYLYHSNLCVPRVNHKILQLEGDYILLGGAISKNFAEKFDRKKKMWLPWTAYSKLAGVVDKLGSIDYAPLLTQTIKAMPYKRAERQDEIYEEIDMTLIDTAKMNEKELTELMDKKMRMDRLKEKEKMRKENPEAFEKARKEEANQKDFFTPQELNTTLFVFGTPKVPCIFSLELTKKKWTCHRVPNSMRLFDRLRILRLLDNQLLLYQNHSDNFIPEDKFILFNPVKFTIQTLPKRIKAVYASQMLQLSADYLYLVGGIRRTEAPLLSNHFEVFSFKDKKWKVLPSMLITRLEFSVFGSKDYIFVAGGMNTNNDVETSIERYNLNQNVWEMIEMKLITPICRGLPLTLSKEFIIMGGLSKHLVLDTVYALRFGFEEKPVCRLMKNMPMLKAVRNPSWLKLGPTIILKYRLGADPMQGILEYRYFDAENVELGPLVEPNLPANTATLGLDPESIG